MAAGVAATGIATLTLCGSASAQIYWANEGGTTISRASLDGLTVTPSFVTGATAPTGVAINATHVYWSHGAGTGSIGRADLDGTSNLTQTLVATASPPGGVALDNRRLYWTHVVSPGNGRIGRARLDGTGAIPSFVATGALPCGVASDADDEYWANTGSPGSIGTAHSDETPNQSFVTATTGPCGVARAGGYVYWTNQAGSSIGRADLDGSNPNQSFIPTGAGSSPCGVAVDGQYVYWSDQAGDTIGRADLDGSNPNQNFITTNVGPDPCGVAVSATQQVTPSTSTFPETAVGSQSDIQALVVMNTASSVLDVTSATLIGANPAEFEKTGDSCTLNATAPGLECILNVRFSPTAPGTSTATLRVTSNASNSPTDIPLTGTATSPAPPPPPADITPPDTTITDGPPSRTKSKLATFAFSGGDAREVASFECRLDSGVFQNCASPKAYGGLKKGSHTFEVRAVDAAGNADPTPASRTWTIKKKKKKK